MGFVVCYQTEPKAPKVLDDLSFPRCISAGSSWYWTTRVASFHSRFGREQHIAFVAVDIHLHQVNRGEAAEFE